MSGEKTFKYDEGLEEKEPLWKSLGYKSLYTRDPVEAFGAMPKIKSGLSDEEKLSVTPEKIAEKLFNELDALINTDEKVVLDLLRIIAPFNSPSFKTVNRIYIEKYGMERGNRSLIEDIIYELADTPYSLARAMQVLDYDLTDVLRKYMREDNKYTSYLTQAMRRSEVQSLEYQERLDLLYLVVKNSGGLTLYSSLDEADLQIKNKEELLVLNLINSFSEDEKIALFNAFKRMSLGDLIRYIKDIRDKGYIPEPEKKREGITSIEESEFSKEVEAINEECEHKKNQIDDDLQEVYENKFRDFAIPYLHQLLNLSEQSAVKEGARYAIEKTTVKELYNNLGEYRSIYKEIFRLRATQQIKKNKLERSKVQSDLSFTGPVLNLITEDKLINEINELESKLNIQREKADNELKKYSIIYPILLDSKLDKEELAKADLYDIGVLLSKDVKATLKSIADVRENIDSDPELIWQAESLISYVKKQLDIKDDSFFGIIVKDKLKAIKTTEEWRDRITLAVSLGLGVAAFFTGGTTALILGGVGSGISLVKSAYDVSQYLTKSAFADAAFSEEYSLTEKDPDNSVLLWLLLDMAGFIGDAAVTLKAFKEIRPVVKGVKAGTNSADDLIEAVGKSELKNAKNIDSVGGIKGYSERILSKIEKIEEDILTGLRRLRQKDPDLYNYFDELFGENSAEFKRIGELIFVSDKHIESINLLKHGLDESYFKI